jgi:hypothetical protein
MAFLNYNDPPSGPKNDPFFDPWKRSMGYNEYHFIVYAGGEWRGFPHAALKDSGLKPVTTTPEQEKSDPRHNANLTYCCCRKRPK